MYYRVKAWFISLKEQSTVGMCIYSCIDFFNKVMSNNVWHYGCFSLFYFCWWYVSSASAYDSWIDISLAFESF